MNNVMLKANTQKHRNLIKEHGRYWVILKEEQPVACFNGDMGVFIRPLGDIESRESRWVRPTDIIRLSEND